jgi:AbrB family looped-hinge helix DNA binding protein
MSKVGERGQITIDKAIREELGIRAGDEAIQRLEDGRIVVEVVPGRHRRSHFEILGPDADRRADGSLGTSRDTAGKSPDPDRREP